MIFFLLHQGSAKAWALSFGFVTSKKVPLLLSFKVFHKQKGSKALVDGCAMNVSLSMSNHQMWRPDWLGSHQSFHILGIICNFSIIFNPLSRCLQLQVTYFFVFVSLKKTVFAKHVTPRSLLLPPFYWSHLFPLIQESISSPDRFGTKHNLA